LGKWQKGWSVVGLTADWVEMDPDKDQHMEFWNISMTVHCMIVYLNITQGRSLWKQAFWQ